MYSILKKIIRNIFPNTLFFKIEPSLRSFYSYFQKGKQHLCSICNFKMKKWVQLPNQDNLCPKCGSLSRDRRLYSILNQEYLLNQNKVLDFSPSRALFRKLKQKKQIDYTASDLSGDFIADKQFDITSINQVNNFYDLIICFHVLEHVIDDYKAMEELYRVLKINGTVLIQTPFKEGEIYEDNTITSARERLEHFGQEDHVRIYSIKGLQNRLEKTGFTVEIRTYSKEDYFGFSENETILLAKK